MPGKQNPYIESTNCASLGKETGPGQAGVGTDNEDAKGETVFLRLPILFCKVRRFSQFLSNG